MDATRQFRPAILPRRSEWINWTLALISLAAWVFLRVQVGPVSGWYLVFVLVMLLLAVVTSLSNWIDRNTVLTLKPEGVAFYNGLRNVSLKWDQVRELRVVPTRFGKRVYVTGELGHEALSRNTDFTFRTLSVHPEKGKVRAKMGFEAGEFIVEQILRSSGLQLMEDPGQDRYYARP